MARLLEYTLNHPLLAALAVAAAVAVIAYEWRHRSHSLAALAPQDVVRLMNQGAAVIDVRSAEEFLQGHIRGARHIPAGDITKAGETLKRYKEKPVVVCCELGPRGRSALAALQEQGFKQVVNLKGGMRAWRAEHLPVARD
ncbi:MAG: rhodanese-like domain-containing protein [Gammaproteobacteria bacterium]|nr:rhodanese-like domain-containing protein [Gammaproteobacteria bacterium]